MTLVALSTLMLVGCSSPDRSLDVPGKSDEVLAVERGDITSVVTMPAVVVAGPLTTLAAPSNGRQFQLSVKVGSVVKAGKEIATYRAGSGTIVLRVIREVTIHRALLAEGASVDENMPLVEVQLNQLALSTQVPVELLYRFQRIDKKARAQLIDGPGPFNCPLISPPATVSNQEKPILICVPDPPLTLFTGLSGLMAVETGSRRGVLTLPISAVAGRAVTGEVTKVTGSVHTVSTVSLGISDGSRIEITEGLSQGDTVLSVAPDLDATTNGPR